MRYDWLGMYLWSTHVSGVHTYTHIFACGECINKCTEWKIIHARVYIEKRTTHARAYTKAEGVGRKGEGDKVKEREGIFLRLVRTHWGIGSDSTHSRLKTCTYKAIAPTWNTCTNQEVKIYKRGKGWTRTHTSSLP